ncbi:MAG: DUF58 domain-containing protein [Actinobacteria bacterium]|nr:DUF58 domain-containing protein [Actinomycetota bacterium]
MILFGRLGGMRELFMAGIGFALILLIGAALVWLRGGRVAVRRTIDPARTSVGRPARIELIVEASGRVGVGPVLLSDKVPEILGPSPRLALPGGIARRQRGVAYPLTPRMRGRYVIGPVEITHTDPFGAVRRRQQVSKTSPLLVVPAYEEINVLPTATQRLGVVRHSPLVGTGDEFYALRAYQEGDDLRKIHWPTSMRTGELVIRQEELLAEPRALIVLDTAASKHVGTGPEASLEAAVSACASVGILALRKRMRLDVLTTDGPLMKTRAPTESVFLEALATLRASRHTKLTRALQRAHRPAAGRPGLIVIISPDLRRDELNAIALRLRGAVAGALVWIDAASFAPTKANRRVPSLLSFGLPLVSVSRGTSFRQAWHTSVKDVALAR